MRGGGIRGGAVGRGRLAEWDGPWRICRDLCCAVRACSAALPVPAISVSGRRRARTASWWPAYKDSDRGSGPETPRPLLAASWCTCGDGLSESWKIGTEARLSWSAGNLLARVQRVTARSWF